MKKREEIIRLWFSMWLKGKDLGIEEIFSEDSKYIECWGPRYKGREEIKDWFEDWNAHSKVLAWDIKQFFHKEEGSVVEWYFKYATDDGTEGAFDGMTLIKWTKDDKIDYLHEFGSK